MTRQEFLDNVNTWYELIDWCNENGCYVCDEIYDEDSYNERIDDQIVEWARNETWQGLRDILNGLPEGYEYYREDDYGDWYGMDEYGDLDGYLSEALDWGDDNGIWEDDEDDEEEYLEEEEAPEFETEDEDIIEIEEVSFNDLFSSCNSTVQCISNEIREKAEKTESEDEEEFDELFFNFIHT